MQFTAVPAYRDVNSIEICYEDGSLIFSVDYPVDAARRFWSQLGAVLRSVDDELRVEAEADEAALVVEAEILAEALGAE